MRCGVRRVFGVVRMVRVDDVSGRYCRDVVMSIMARLRIGCGRFGKAATVIAGANGCGWVAVGVGIAPSATGRLIIGCGADEHVLDAEC